MPSPSPSPFPQTEIQIHTYHCLCTTHLLTTPYLLSSLPHRAPPALDNAIILPLPRLTTSSSSSSNPDPDPDAHPTTTTTTTADEDEDPVREHEEGKEKGKVLPSLLSPSMRLARKVIVVRREDGFEKRRVWRCGRCGVGVGYEVVGAGEKGAEGERVRVMYLLEGGLRETGEMG